MSSAWSVRDLTAPLAGVSSPVIALATRRVERRWRDEVTGAADRDGEAVVSVLAALALAVDQRHPDFVTDLVPHPPSRLGRRLVEMLRTELVREWMEAAPAPAPSQILGTLSALEQVRQAIDANGGQPLGSSPRDAEELDLLVEIAHDLRSPLTAILFLAETLQRGASGDVNAVQRRQLGLIYSAALGLSALVSDALELARGGCELADDELSPFSVATLLESVRDMVRPMADEKGLEVRLAPPEPDFRLGHPIALARVLLNLTTNALKFTETGAVDIRCVPCDAVRVEFSVQDTGRGIRPEALVNLFEPFHRAAGDGRSRFSGTGLGLVITRRLVRALDSELQVETHLGAGTRFFFKLDLPPSVYV